MPLQGEYAPNPHAWVREHVEKYEGSGGTDGVIMNGDPTVVLTTRGAKTGLLRKSPVMKVEHDGVYVVVGSLGGKPMNPAWVANIRADPHVELQDGPVKRDWKARELAGEERELWWERSVAAFPNSAEYQLKTDRVIPVFVLEPLD
ncbi:MAG: putative nitroreductase [Frankiales bacterium]|nr:putative nitroreductase [Frankiales bacterium]